MSRDLSRDPERVKIHKKLKQKQLQQLLKSLVVTVCIFSNNYTVIRNKNECICLTSLTRADSDCQLLVCRLIFGHIENQK